MDVSRGFLIMGSLYLLVGIVFGGYMGASGDHSLFPVPAHNGWCNPGWRRPAR